MQPHYEGHIIYQGKKWSIAVEFFRDENGSSAAYTHFLEIDAYNRLFTVSPNKDSVMLSREQPPGRPPIIFKGIVRGDSISGSWDGIGIIGAQFNLKAKVPPSFRTEELQFGHDSIHLSGTLMLPPGPGKFPAVVFMHGGASEDRDVYYGIAMRFVKKGIAALVYDKRGVGKSTGGDWRTAGISGLAADAITAVELLRSRADMDTTAIGVFGHSEGGWTAPAAAVHSDAVRFVIASAASPVNATDQSVHHREGVMREEGFAESAITKASAIRIRMNEATKLCYTDTASAVKKLQVAITEINAVKQEPWFAASALPPDLYPGCPSKEVMELLFTDPRDIWKQVKVPVYLVWGDKDIVVPIHKRSRIINSLHDSGNKNVTVKMQAGVNHFIMLQSGSAEWDFPRQAPGYFEEMVNWIKHSSPGSKI